MDRSLRRRRRCGLVLPLLQQLLLTDKIAHLSFYRVRRRAWPLRMPGPCCSRIGLWSAVSDVHQTYGYLPSRRASLSMFTAREHGPQCVRVVWTGREHGQDALRLGR